MAEAAIKESGLSRYLEIAAVLQREIAGGRWADGDKLPSIKDLATRFKVAPLTSRQAVKYLEGRGIVECRKGAGTFVSGPLLKLQMFSLNKNIEKVVDQVSLGVLRNLRPPASGKTPEIPQGLKLANAYIGFNRLFTLETQPALLSRTFLDRRVYELSPDIYNRMPVLPQLMHNSGLPTKRHSLVMTVEPASNEESRLLKLAPFASVAKLKLVLINPDDEAVYVGTLIFPADLVRVEF